MSVFRDVSGAYIYNYFALLVKNFVANERTFRDHSDLFAPLY